MGVLSCVELSWQFGLQSRAAIMVAWAATTNLVAQTAVPPWEAQCIVLSLQLLVDNVS